MELSQLLLKPPRGKEPHKVLGRHAPRASGLPSDTTSPASSEGFSGEETVQAALSEEVPLEEEVAKQMAVEVPAEQVAAETLEVQYCDGLRLRHY